MIKRLLNHLSFSRIFSILVLYLLLPTTAWAKVYTTGDLTNDGDIWYWAITDATEATRWTITPDAQNPNTITGENNTLSISANGSCTMKLSLPVSQVSQELAWKIKVSGLKDNNGVTITVGDKQFFPTSLPGVFLLNSPYRWTENDVFIISISNTQCDIREIEVYADVSGKTLEATWPEDPAAEEGDISGIKKEYNGDNITLRGHCMAGTQIYYELNTDQAFPVYYLSSNPSVAETDETGAIRVKAKGQTTITAIPTSEESGQSFCQPYSYSYTLDITAIDLGITVGGVSVNLDNYTNIIGDGIDLEENGKVSFEPAVVVIDQQGTSTSATLTLENANITGSIVWNNSDNLNIALNGTNSITTENNPSIKTEFETSLVFVKDSEAEPCRLSISGNIEGFHNDSFISESGGLFYYREGNTVITSLGGGSGTEVDPILIKTKEDLKDFAKLVNNGTISNEYIKLNPEGEELDCNGLTGFEPIGILINSSNNHPFIGKFDGNNCTIKNLTYSTTGTGDRVGLFGYVGNEDVSDTKIEKLTLSNCSFNGGEYVGGIVGELSNGTIENCVLSSCTVKSGNAQIPYAGGIAGQVANGTINKCTFNSGLVDCTTAYSGAPSGGVYAGGIVGNIYTTNSVTVSLCTVSSTNVKSVQNGEGAYDIYAGGLVGCSIGTVAISGNKVTTTDNTKKISCQSGVDYTNYHCGAIIGKKGDATTLTNNSYEYNVTTDIAETSKSGYTHRGVGGNVDNPDIIENKGAVLYTKPVVLPAESSAGTIMGKEGTYYSTVVENDVLSILVAPHQTATIIATPGDTYYTPVWLKAVNGENTIATDSTYTDGVKTYTFEMPDAEVTVTAKFAIDLSANNITATIANATYTGEAIEPTTIAVDGITNVTSLTNGADFTITGYTKSGEAVASPISAGTYTVSIEGKGNYTGTKDISFTITKGYAGLYFYRMDGAQESPVNTIQNATYGVAFDSPKLKNPHNLTATLSCKAENDLSAAESDVATIDSEGTLTILKAGRVYVYATTEGNANYESQTEHYVLNIAKTSLNNVTIADIADKTFTGSAIEPAVTVTLNGEDVSTGDYTISYINNINVSTDANKATITLTAKSTSEHFTEGTTKTATFNIVAKSITDDMIQAIADQTYSFGNAITPTVTVKDGETTLTLATTADDTGDYSIAYSNNTNAAKSTDEMAPTVTITGKGNYTGTASKTFTINPMAVATATISLSDATLTYNGAVQHPTISSIEGNNSEGSTLEFISSDYTVSYEQNENTLTADDVKDAGGYTLVAIFGGNYSGTATTTFNIAAKDLSDAATIATIPVQTYTGNEIKPEPAVSIVLIDGNDATTLTKGTDFDYSYANNINASEQAEVQPTVTITGKGNYTGSASQTFSITNATMTVTATGYNGTYDGNAHGITVAAPEGATVTYGTKKGTYDKTESPTYTDAGSYMVHYQVERTNYATITDSAKVEITKATPSITFDKESYSATYGETFTAPTASTNPEGLTVTTTSSSNTQVATISDGVITIVGVGETTITVSFAGSNNYEATTATYKLNVAAGTIIGVTATGYSDVYDGKAHGITATAPEGATIKYGTKKGTYNLDQSPTFSDAGTYMVHYQVECTNYTTLIDSVKVEITKANITPSITLEGWAYGTTANTPEVTGNTGNGTETFTYKAEGSEAFTSEVPTAVGTHTVKVTIGETTNYNGGEATTTFAITNRTIDPAKDITFAEGQSYASFYSANEDLVLPESGIAVYMITGIEGNTLITQAVSYIPKGVPVLIEKTETAVEAKDPSEAGTNMLQYATEDVAASGTLYILYNGEYVKATGTIPQGKCYLKLNKPSGARALAIGNNNGTTSISNFNADTETDRWFDLNGQRISKPQKKGLYIKNGKKIVVK